MAGKADLNDEQFHDGMSKIAAATYIVANKIESDHYDLVNAAFQAGYQKAVELAALREVEQ